MKKTNKALSVQEARIVMFKRMIARGTATNDVMSFAKNQAACKKAGRGTYQKLLHTAMRSKLDDACAYTVRLRRQRRQLRKQLLLHIAQ